VIVFAPGAIPEISATRLTAPRASRCSSRPATAVQPANRCGAAGLARIPAAAPSPLDAVLRVAVGDAGWRTAEAKSRLVGLERAVAYQQAEQVPSASP
jgi:hypothetical protein